MEEKLAMEKAALVELENELAGLQVSLPLPTSQQVDIRAPVPALPMTRMQVAPASAAQGGKKRMPPPAAREEVLYPRI